MNEEEFAKLQVEIEQAKANQGNVVQDAQASELRERERSMVYEQTNLGDELFLIENLLRGKVLKTDEQGVQKWVTPEDSEMIVLTEHGVHLIMNTITFYLNKNTLLSNYDAETINRKMEDFATALADVVFMEYEKVFKYPTLQECKEKLMERLERKAELRKFALELVGKEGDEKELKKEFIKEIEDKIESEITKIREQVIKNKLKRFEIIIREVQDAVHSTYLRALFGLERKTLRQHIHVSETINPNFIPQQKKTGGFNPLRLFGK